MAESEVNVVSRLRLDRDSWASDLQGAKSQMTEFVQGLSQQRITIPLAVDLTEVSARLQAFRVEQESRPIRIPVEMVPAGGGIPSGGGGGWGGRLSTLMPGGGDDAIYNGPGGMGGGFGGGGGNVSNVVNYTYNTMNTATTMGGNVVNNAVAGGGRGAGLIGGRGLFGRFLLMEMARAPIERAEQEYAAFQRLDQANAMGSATDSRRALINSLEVSGGGISGFLTDGIGLTNYREQARDMMRQEGVLSGGQAALEAQGRARVSELTSLASGSADPYQRRRFEREAQYTRAVQEAKSRAAADIDKQNFDGRRKEIERQYQADIANAQGMMTGSATDEEADAKAQAAQQAIAQAEQSRKARLDQLTKQRQSFEDEANKAIQAALDVKTAGENEDTASQAVRGIESGLRVTQGHLAAGELLSRATGGVAAASDRAYENRVRAEIKALEDKAAAIEKVDAAQAKLLRTQAQGRREDLATEMEARAYERQAREDAGTMTVQGMASRNRSLGMRLGGNLLGASLEDINQQAADAKAALGKQLAAGQLTQAQYVRAMAEVDQSASLQGQQAQREDSLRNLRLGNAVTLSGDVSSFARRRDAITGRIAEERLAMPGHDAAFDTIQANELGTLNREHDQSIRLMNASAHATNLRAMGRTHEAEMGELSAREQAELENNSDDPAAQDAIRAKFQAQRNLLNMPHFSQTDSRSVYMGAVRAALMGSVAARMPGLGAAALGANPGMGQPIGMGRPPGGGQFPAGAFGNGHAAANHAIHQANNPVPSSPGGSPAGAGAESSKFKDAVDKMYDTFQNSIQIFVAGATG